NARPEVLFDKADSRLDLTLPFRPVGTANPRHETVITGELQELLLEVQLAAMAIDQHGFHAVGEDTFSHAAEIMEGMHHATQQVMDILPLCELQIAHARVAQREPEGVKPTALPVAEMPPVHLTLLARTGFEAYEGALALFFPPGQHYEFQLR